MKESRTYLLSFNDRQKNTIVEKRKVLVLGSMENDLAEYACQQLDIKTNRQFEILSYSVASAREEGEFRAYSGSSIEKNNFLDLNYDILVSVDLKAIQLLKKIPTYNEIVFWNIEDDNRAYESISENVNFFISRFVYQA